MSGLTRGEVGKRTNVNVETLRYYERCGLLPAPPRTTSNYRVYPYKTVEVVLFIKRAQDLGFPLKEIKELLALRSAGRPPCPEVCKRTEAKLSNIDERIQTLQSLRQLLVQLLRKCPRNQPVTTCPILEAIENEETRI
ncbi:MAG: MerR family DNA-binding protein [Candidatus Melainabacteria bacterium]|nr:MerR family DNA-binding protein [Candidatus Melainabacteria bacterium]